MESHLDVYEGYEDEEVLHETGEETTESKIKMSSYETLIEKSDFLTKKTNKKQKHNYTSELELKSLLIRIKNDRENNTNKKLNKRINKYIKWHISISNKKYDAPSRRNKIKTILKQRIVRDSELTCIDNSSYERFGQIILLMIKNILKKPQFSGYTYKDDFYSDAVYKILKYLGNFNHELISERTGTPVNAFAYVSQIIHNSILFIINTKKKENDRLKHQVQMTNLEHNLQIKYYELVHPQKQEEMQEQTTRTIDLESIDISLVDEMKKLELDHNYNIEIHYPKDYRISFDEYNELKDLLKGNISIMRKK